MSPFLYSSPLYQTHNNKHNILHVMTAPSPATVRRYIKHSRYGTMCPPRLLPATIFPAYQKEIDAEIKMAVPPVHKNDNEDKCLLLFPLFSEIPKALANECAREFAGTLKASNDF
jgi:hypothetical protein